MKAEKHKSLNEHKQKDSKQVKLRIEKEGKWLLVLELKSISIPLFKSERLEQVIQLAEKFSARLSTKIDHSLGLNLQLIEHKAIKLAGGDAWFYRVKIEFDSVYSAYLRLRSSYHSTEGVYIRCESEGTVSLLTGSQGCNDQVARLITLLEGGEPRATNKGQCARCLTKYVIDPENNGSYLCLDCGYED